MSINTLNSKEIIIFIHGINSSSKAFKKMGKYFSKDYKIIYFDYSSSKYDIQELSEDFLKPVIEKIPSNDTINFVTHSMGAIILRNYLKNNKPKNIKRIVMIAPPNQGSEVADFFKNTFIFKMRYHKCWSVLTSEGIKKLNLPDCKNYNCGIIAGTKTQLPFFSIFIKGQDDGKISVNNTKLKGMKDFIKIPYPHDTIMKKEETISLTFNFIKYGRFIK